MIQHPTQTAKKFTAQERHTQYLREKRAEAYRADSRRVREIPLVVAKILKTHKEAASQFTKLASKDSKTAEKVLRLFIQKMQDYEKTKGQKGKLVGLKANAALVEFWSEQVSLIERKFIDLNQSEAREIRSKGANNLFTVEATLSRIATELYLKAQAEEKGSRMASALFRAFSIWQQEAASAGSSAKTQFRKQK